MIPNISKKILLYPLFGILIFSIIKVLPNNCLSNLDTILISIITIVLCVCLEKTMSSNFCPIQKPTKCSMPNLEKLTNSVNPKQSKEHFELLKKLKELTQKNKTVEHQTQISSSKKSSTNITPVKPSSSATTPTKTVPTNTTPTKTAPTKTAPTKTAPTKTTNMPTSTDTRLSSVKANADKISFPFTFEFLQKTMDEMRLISSGDDKKKREIQEAEMRLQMNARSNEYFEMLIQLMQRDLDLVYRYINKETFNKLNKIILGLSLRRSELMNQNTNLTDMEKLSRTQSREISATMSKYMKSMSGSAKYIDDKGFIQNMINNDMKYSMYTPKQHEKLGAYDSTFNNKWDNDYVLLNTDKWMPPITHRMYKCKTEKQCPVCPSLTKGYPVKVKEFDLARKILPPDVINEDYIREKLLTGLA
jgi:hypothetical protein